MKDYKFDILEMQKSSISQAVQRTSCFKFLNLMVLDYLAQRFMPLAQVLPFPMCIRH